MQTDPTSPVLAHVSANVRRLRIGANLSQAALADRSGISRRTVVKLEAGEANISLTGLDHLAEALGVAFVDLIAAPTAPRSDINEVAWKGRAAGSLAMLLASVPASKDAQLWTWVLAPGDRYDAEPDPMGWSEMLHVSEGALHVVKQDGDVTLRTGDHLAFPTDQQYAYVNEESASTRFVRIVVR